jgi:hypothetical protein
MHAMRIAHFFFNTRMATWSLAAIADTVLYDVLYREVVRHI